MDLSERQYDRIARYLDGGAVELDEAEQAEAARIAGQERWAGQMLDVRVPSSALASARRHLTAAMIAPRSGVLRFAYYAAAGAVAAAIVLAVTVMPHGAGKATARHVPTAVLFGEQEATADETVLAAIAQQVQGLEEQLIVSVPPQPHEAFNLEPYPAPTVQETTSDDQLQDELSG